MQLFFGSKLRNWLPGTACTVLRMFSQLMKAGKVPPATVIDVGAEDDFPAPAVVGKRELDVTVKVEREIPSAQPDASQSTSPVRTPVKRSLSPTASTFAPAWLKEVEHVDASSSDSDIHAKSMQVNAILQANASIDPLLQKPVVKAAKSHADDNELEAHMKRAIDAGKIPARNDRLSRMWDKAIKEDLLLSRRYAKALKNHASQQAIKAKWLQGIYDTAKKSRIAEDVDETRDSCDGKYLNFP